MSHCRIEIKFNGSAHEYVAKAKKAIESVKGHFDGNDKNGEFKVHTVLGNINGTYVVENSLLILTVTHKPFLLSCKVLEKEMREYIAPHIA